MNKICKGAKVGISIQACSFLIMLVLIVMNQMIPEVLPWLFFMGLVISLISSVVTLVEVNKI